MGVPSLAKTDNGHIYIITKNLLGYVNHISLQLVQVFTKE